ncbi:unnamed protein product [Schistosoma margrebowiei]|uniref:Uncharacterized protein n=1 Tax=Schistosoma margrebowiei TaxID=48269 RepID=A0A3P8BHT8_9TREM|nr:unnamed protein product [Schistosoma margrebowiei]
MISSVYIESMMPSPSPPPAKAAVELELIAYTPALTPLVGFRFVETLSSKGLFVLRVSTIS